MELLSFALVREAMPSRKPFPRSRLPETAAAGDARKQRLYEIFSAARSFALRDRGLRSTSSSDAVTGLGVSTR